jgi:TolB-like protein/Tfp pilus assembly protein PilF
MTERRLAAIMFIDVVGFTSLSQRNEEKALALLEEYRNLLRPIFSLHNGKEVKTIGDGFLVEFGSALQAVRCAFGIQQVMHDRNSSRSSEDAIEARVGIHVGDVVHSDSDIYGDAVNIASRIEPLAEAGGICISQPVQVQVANKFEFPITSLGPKSLKNVYAPVEVFKVVLPWEGSSTAVTSPQPKTRVAVLPFSNISPEKSDEYFADGMTEELINVISHNHQLKVIARTTVGRYKDTPKSIQEIGKEIGAGTILEGSVRKAGNKVRVTAQLIDAVTEDHLWSDNYDRQLDDVFTIQSEIAKSVSDALMAKLLPAEQEGLARKATKNPAAHVLYLRGRTALRERSEAKMKEAKKLFEEAIAEDSQYAEAYAGLADACFLLGDYNYMPFAEARAKAREALDRALSLNDDLVDAHTTLAQFLAADYRFQEGEEEFKRAISLNPNYSLAHHWYAICLLETGELDRAIEETRLAQELDPLSTALASNLAFSYAVAGNLALADEQMRKLKALDTSNRLTDYSMALLAELRGDFRAAADHTEEAIRRYPERTWYSASLGYFLGRAGESGRATEILNKLKSLPEDTNEKPAMLGLVYSGLGMWDEMFKQYNLAFENRSLGFRVLRYTTVNPLIRNDPRYAALFHRANLRP